MNLSGTIINNCYIIRELLSKNSIGSLWSAQPIFSARQFLLFFLNTELFKKDKENILSFKKKIFSLPTEINENIANIVEIDEFEDNLYISFEIGEFKSLMEYMRKIRNNSFNNIYFIIEYTAGALKAMHEKGLIHGMLLPDYIWIEIKQNNIQNVKFLNFYFNELAGIVDFKIDKDDKVFFPAEIHESRFNDVDKSSDLYFIGIIFYQLLTSTFNLDKNDLENISNLIIDDEKIKSELVRIIKKLLNKNKENRYPDIDSFLEDFYLIAGKIKKSIGEKSDPLKNDTGDRAYNRIEFGQGEYGNKKSDFNSSKERIDYFNRLETERKNYYDKSNYEDRQIYFEKLDKERREYYNRVADERTSFLDNLVINTREYLNEISGGEFSNNKIDNKQKSYFEEITERAKSYALKITDKIKEYYAYLSREIRPNIGKKDKAAALEESYFKNIVSETGRHYKNLIEEAGKYYLNLSNEARKYSENIKGEVSGKEEISGNKAGEKNKLYNSLQTETIEYFKKLENEANEYSKNTMKEWESRDKKSKEEKSAFDKADEDRKDFYKKKESESAVVKYFENLEKEKIENKKEDNEQKEEKSELQKYLEDRSRYYQEKSSGYKKEHTDYFNRSNDSVKQLFDRDKIDDNAEKEYQKAAVEDERKKIKNGGKKEQGYSLRDDFVVKDNRLSFFKKLLKNASGSGGNVCFIDAGGDDNFDRFINKFKEKHVKDGIKCIDIDCKNYNSENLFKIILKKYEEQADTGKKIKYDFNISGENDKDIEKASEVVLNIGEKKKPLVIILREIQFIDKVSLLILNGIIKRISDYPLLFICTYRKDELNENELLTKIVS